MTLQQQEMTEEIIAALEIEKPVVLGCSIGGRIVLHLAIAHAREFRALIGLESAAFQEPWYDLDWLHRSDVDSSEVSAALVSGLIAPQAPEEARWETLWFYLSSAPGVFKGDLHFYRVDGDLRVAQRKRQQSKRDDPKRRITHSGFLGHRPILSPGSHP